ncbi:mucin-2-like [Wyeomyia smithii]|uniref:mucin-2-like n=1 Tax=Wyeomyia smithii TaxID=174621 RepID=UPI00246821A7|nr:mucin-2-like [Wyeomyia smithii]XP_055532149.1 mucin-2-like [Wyeomyia smithii]
MLQLLISACLVTYGVCRPDVSHILKQNRTGKAFHPLDYLAEQKLDSGGKAAQRNEFGIFDYFSAFNESEVNNLGVGLPLVAKTGSDRNAWGRGFRNSIKPSPFKRNVVQNGYTYEKPANPLPIKPSGPLDFPINPDANLIKPVSTQAPEYLPPLQQQPAAGTTIGSSTTASTQTLNTINDSSIQKQSARTPLTDNTESGYDSTTTGIENQESDKFTSTTSSYKPQETTPSATAQPLNVDGSQNVLNMNGYPGPNDSESSTENVFTGYPRGPTTPSTSPVAQSSFSDFSQETTVVPYDTSDPTGSSSTAQQKNDNDQGYNYNKPVIPPNLNDVIGEPGDINELATTTQSTTTTRKLNGLFIPPKPVPGLVVPETPSTEKTPTVTTATMRPAVETTTGFIPAQSMSTAAPEYLPPGDSSETNAPYDSTQQSSTDLTQSTVAFATRLPGSEPATPAQMTTNTIFNMESTQTEGYTSPDEDVSPFSGYSTSRPSSVGYTLPTSDIPSYSTTIHVSESSSSHEQPEYSTTGHSAGTTVGDFSSPSFASESKSEPQYSTSTSAVGQSSLSTAAPEYLPPDADGTTGYFYPQANTSTVFPEYRPERTDLPPSNQPSLENLAGSSKPSMEAMPIISECNNLAPDMNSQPNYLPPDMEDNTGLRIVVEDSPLNDGSVILPQERHSSTAADTITTYHPTTSPRTTAAIESEAEGSELQPQLAAAASDTNEAGYNYQVPGDKLPPPPAPVVPSHTLDDSGYHYKIPSVPFQ